jgi:phosphoglycolate phosphatase
MAACIFDLDGTLLDTLEDLYLSVNAALEAQGLPAVSREHVQATVGNGMSHLIAHCVPEGTSPEKTSDVLTFFLEHYAAHSADHTEPYDGILDLLRALKDAGWALAVVSNKGDFATQTLVATKLDGLIDIAIGNRASLARKPNPAMIRAAEAELGQLQSSRARTAAARRDAATPAPKAGCALFPANGTVYVGDSEVDIATAANAGVPLYAVTWGFRTRAQLEEAGATCLFDTPAELAKALGV